MSATTIAIALSLAALASPPGHQGSEWSRQRLLATPKPHLAQRVDSPARIENGRLWVSSYPVGSRTSPASQTLYEPGPAHFGAPIEALHATIYVRLASAQVIAISPWERFESQGMERLERARNIWLREQGLVQKVRTHVNARFIQRDEYTKREHSLPKPRATIKLHVPTPRRATDRWAQAADTTAHSNQVVRVVAPGLRRNLPPRVITPATDAIASRDE